MSYIQVAINSPLHKTFLYKVTDNKCPLAKQELTLVGFRVLVNFHHRNVIAIVVNESNELPRELESQNIKIKEVISFLDKTAIFSGDIIKLLLWIATYYHQPIGEVFYTALPILLRKDTQTPVPLISYWTKTAKDKVSSKDKLSEKALKALEFLEGRTLSTQEFKELGILSTTLKSLANKGYIAPLKDYDSSNNNWLVQDFIGKELPPNEAQKQAIDYITKEAQSGFKVFLINGVTGSGKTEIYLQLIAKTLAQGKQVMVLIPEINLTPQTITRFYERFKVPIVCIHSSLRDDEKLSSFIKLRDNKAAILIGTRSALFANFNNLGLIVVDEEHDQSYRQTQGVIYHARDCAVMRAHINNIPIILGSATPSFESLANVLKGKYHQLILPVRAGNAANVTSYVVDMRKTHKDDIFSQKLLTEIQNTLAKGEQVLLFLNRRGYAPAQICHDCGYVFKCQDCDANLCYHKETKTLICHHCERQYPLPKTCPNCHGHNIVPEGVGTENVIEQLAMLFPEAHLARIDRDSTARKGELEKFIEDINNNKYQILVGTQMLAKGHHFPLVTLVGILNIDSYLYSNDYRAPEKLAQLITQVSGRAGRAELQGKTILQTHNIDHPLLKLLLKHDYNYFAQANLTQRKMNFLPPFSYQALIRADAYKRETVQNFLNNIYNILEKIQQKISYFSFTLPYTSTVERRQKRFHMILLVESSERKILHQVLEILEKEIPNIKVGTSDFHQVIDVDPIEIF